MATFTENDLSSLLLENTSLRLVEPSIYSVLASDESGNAYDTQFGFVYDLIACNPLYNRLVWGYSVKIFPQIAGAALRSSPEGNVLDLGCGSLAFTAKIYSQYAERPVLLADQSVKMLRMAKARLIKQHGQVPGNLLFLHADARRLPFHEQAFATIISENLLHCLADTGILLKQLNNIISVHGKIYLTTLVKSRRWADKYLQMLADGGKIIARTVADHQAVFRQVGWEANFAATGNILVIQCQKA